MGFLNDLLFGKSTPGTPGKVVDPTPSQYKNLRDPVAGGISGIIASQGGPKYGGQFTAGLGAGEQQGLGLTAQLGYNQQPLTQQAQQSAFQFLNGGQQGGYVNPSLAGGFGLLANSTSNPFVGYGTSAAPGLLNTANGGNSNPFTQAGVGALGNVGNFANSTGAANPLQGVAGDALNAILQPGALEAATNPALRAQIDSASRPLFEQFNENTLPGLRSQFTQAGQRIQGNGSSPFAMATARASSGLANAIGDVGTNLTSANMQQINALRGQLVPQALGLQENARQFDAGQALNASQFLSGLGAGTNTADSGNALQAGLGLAGIGSSGVQQQVGVDTSNGQFLTGLGAQGSEAAAGREQAAIPQAQALTQADFDRAVQTLQTQALPRLIEQYGLDQGLAEFQRQMQMFLSTLQLGGQVSSQNAAVIQPTQGTQGAAPIHFNVGLGS